MCLFPIQVFKYTDDGSVHFGVNQHPDREVIPFKIPCGHCIECYLSKSREWQARILYEAKQYESNCFITLTLDNEHDTGQLEKGYYQKFLKRLRKRVGKVRYFLAGEYGGDNGRPHFHCILFGYKFPDLYFWKLSKRGKPLFRSPLLEFLWPLGFSVVEDLTPQTALYCAKYLQKLDPRPHEVSAFCSMSLHPGIGLGAVTDIELNTDLIYTSAGMQKVPRYFLEKLCDDNEIKEIKQKRLFKAGMIDNSNVEGRKIKYLKKFHFLR